MTTVQIYEETKNPSSDLDYGRNWGDAPNGDKGWLGTNELIVESVWEILADKEKVPTLVPADQGTGIDATGKITSIFLKGGTAGIRYKLYNTIKTTDTITNAERIEKKLGIIICCLD